MVDRNVELNNKTILVTGSPGFIGANLVVRLYMSCLLDTSLVLTA